METLLRINKALAVCVLILFLVAFAARVTRDKGMIHRTPARADHCSGMCKSSDK
jgi:hypothetical protein